MDEPLIFMNGNGHEGPDGQAILAERRSVRSLAQTLVETGMLSRQQLEDAQDLAQRERVAFARILVREGLVRSRDLAALMAMHLGLTLVDLRTETLEPSVLDLTPEDLARRYLVLPLNVLEDGRLRVAMADPTDFNALQDMTVRAGMDIVPVVATPEDILEHIDLSYRLIASSQSDEADADQEPGPDRQVTARKLRTAPPAQVIDILLRQALHDRASDVHLHPTESHLRVRFRIDGILHDVMSLPREQHPILISRLKIMSGMNIAERRRPQDGQFTLETGAQKVDVRVAISNTVAGEMAALRLLDNKRFTLLGLEQLGMSDSTIERYRRLLHLPYGMIVVCGPTGSGKSTSLYASILQMNRRESHVISLEDPVEYHITDANQMQVNTEAGVTFATQLRSVLRLDPDVILVGEIRDQETAVIATQAALTGHLVLTSLHANDAVSALLRLRDLGVAPYLVSSAVAGIVSQRMVRVVCESCGAAEVRPKTEQDAFMKELGERQEQFVYGAGCNICAHTGYKGRRGVYEVLTMTDALRTAFLDEAPRHELLNIALNDGLVPMRRDGMLKVKQGVTTPYEVIRVLFSLD